VEWPEQVLSLPYIDFEGKERNSTLISDPEWASLDWRSRWNKSYATLSVHWVFTDWATYETFLWFWREVLGMGTSCFSIALAYPKLSELTTWMVRFVSDLEMEVEPGSWTVHASLDLLSPVEIEEGSPVIGYTAFQVLEDEETGASYLDFELKDGNLYSVKS
jgi:hypothetical protein